MLDAIEVILHPRKNYCSCSAKTCDASGAEILAKHRRKDCPSQLPITTLMP